jgi:hypothetical protein
MAGPLSSLQATRNPIVSLGTAALILAAAYYAADAIINNDPNSLAYLALVFLGGSVVVAVLNDWRRGLYFFVSWLLFEDFARKYLGNNMAIYFGKDFLVLLLYVSFFRERRMKRMERFKIPFQMPLLFFVWFGVLQMFNPSSTSIFYGLLGIKVDFLYIPLIYLGYSLVNEEKELQRFLSFFCVLIIVVATLGLVQSILGPTFLNPSNLQENIRALATTYRVAPISGAVAYRPTSVFVSAGRFTNFLLVSWVIVLGYSGYLILRSRRGRALAFTTIGIVAAASLMTASRGAFMWSAGIAIIFVVGFTWGAPWREREAIRVLRAVTRTGICVSIAVTLLVALYPREIGSRLAIYSETLMPDSPASELMQRTQTYPLKQVEYAFSYPLWPFGYGMGTCTLGTQYVVKLLHAPPMNIGVESGYGNLVVELGIVGLILWFVLAFAVAGSCWRVVLLLRGSPWFPLAMAIGLYAFLIFFPIEFLSSVAYEDFVLNSSLWLLLGFLFRLKTYPNLIHERAKGISDPWFTPRRT